MRTETQKEDILASIKILNLTLLQAIRQFQETWSILSREFELPNTASDDDNDHGAEFSDSFGAYESFNRPIADRKTLSVVFQGKTCFLGNTLLFRFFETLARRPNRYFSHSELLDEVWGGPRTDATIRNVAKRLRDRLTSAGLGEIAASIDGSTPKYYVLRLTRK